MNQIKTKLKYIHRTQKPSLCGPTSLQMILERHGISIDPEVIAKAIGVKVAPHETHVFNIPLPVGEHPKEFGMALEDFESPRVKNFLAKQPIRLEPKVYKYREIGNLGQFIYDNLLQDNDLMADIWMAHYRKDLPMGHYCLISQIEGEKVTICDPWPDTDAYWETDVKELMRAMEDSYDGTERGFVVFKRVTG